MALLVRSVGFFLLVCLSRVVEEKIFPPVSPLDPQGGVLDVLPVVPFPTPLVFAVPVLVSYLLGKVGVW